MEPKMTLLGAALTTTSEAEVSADRSSRARSASDRRHVGFYRVVLVGAWAMTAVVLFALSFLGPGMLFMCPIILVLGGVFPALYDKAYPDPPELKRPRST